MLREVATQMAGNAQCLKILAIFANSCYSLLKENKFKKDEASQELALRGMVAAFVVCNKFPLYSCPILPVSYPCSLQIYDHGNTDLGAFQRRSDTKAQKICNMVAKDYSSLYGNDKHCEGLDAIIKYASANFSAQTTPASIKNAFE